MVRIRDRIWNHVEKTDEVWKCMFCDHVFAKGIAAQIVKCHLAGVGGPGTKFCSDVPGHVKMEARREINEGEKKRRIIMSTSPSSSSNVSVEVSPKNDGEIMKEQETILRSRDGGVVERESDQEMIEAEFPAVMVEKGDSVCEICRHVFERRTPAKRMQWHLAEIGGSGDTICTSMPDDVKSATLQEITESKRKRRKTVPGSSHSEDVPTMSIEDVAVQPLEAGWSGITKALEDLHNEADHGVRNEKMVEVEDASVKASREEEITGVPPGDLRQPTEKDHEQFQKLKILNLSWCDEIEELPRSISDLVNLTALLLRGCRNLIHVPSLAKLEKLKKLDLSRCERLKHMPEGVRFLLNLKYLDLSGTGIKETVSGIIPMLSGLQVLKVCDEYGVSKISIRGSEVGELRMLETLHCVFSNFREFGNYMKSRERSQQSPSDYSIFIQREHSYSPTFSKLGSRKFVKVIGENFIDALALPTDIEALKIHFCDDIKQIFAMREWRGFPFSNYSLLNLKLIDIYRCSKLKKLFLPSLLPNLHNLQEISVQFCYDMEEIFSTDREGEWMGFPNYSTRSRSIHSLLNLKVIDIRHCDKLKTLFRPSLLPNLHNLQKISVHFCGDMEEIFSTEEEDGQELLFDPPNLTGLHLSRLTTLELCYLPELRSIYVFAIICHSLEQILLVDCPELKRITLPLPQPSLQRIQFYPEELWESLHWGEANDKNHLESLCVFKERFESGSEECSRDECNQIEEEKKEEEKMTDLGKFGGRSGAFVGN